MAKGYGVPNVNLISNGQVITDDDIDKFIQYGLDEVTISTHGVSRNTYERMMVGASYAKHHSLLKKLEMKKRRGGKEAFLKNQLYG